MPNEFVKIGVIAASLSSDAREAVRLSREMGFEGVQFDAVSSLIDLTTLSASGRREFRNILSSQDQQLVGLRAGIGREGFGLGADVDRAIARIEAAMEAAAGLQSPLVCIDLGALPAVQAPAMEKPKVTGAMAGLILLPESAAAKPQATESSPPPDPAFVSQVSAAMDQLGRRADRYSVLLAFRSELASFASLKAAVLSVNCPWFGIDLDPVSVLHDRWDLDKVFSELGALIRHVRGRDALRGAENRTQAVAIGKGNVDWEAMLTNLDEAGYQGWITIDPVDLADRVGAAREGLRQLRALR
jgi:sugar phosphate isomerase/epimerase